MYSIRTTLTLLITSLILFTSFVLFLIFHEDPGDPVRETVREEVRIDTTERPLTEGESKDDTPVSQEFLHTDRALGTDHGMEFPTLEE
jgi:ABC-type dipeptide/oligopeptide/nickel transport system permease component